MTTTASRPKRGVSLGRTATHTAIITRRNVLRFVRIPALLLFSTVQPVMFLLLFNYVFGGAIAGGVPAGIEFDYINWLIPGILVSGLQACTRVDVVELVIKRLFPCLGDPIRRVSRRFF